MAALFDLVRAINSARTAGVGGPFYEAAQRTLRDLAGVLGLTLAGSSLGAAESDNGVAARPFVDLLVGVRNELRVAKQWQLADRVRDGLKELGVVLEDSPDGTAWRFEER